MMEFRGDADGWIVQSSAIATDLTPLISPRRGAWLGPDDKSIASRPSSGLGPNLGTQSGNLNARHPKFSGATNQAHQQQPLFEEWRPNDRS